MSNDREARTERYKLLFGFRRKMVGSDSTFARVLKWLKPQEGQRFLLSFLPTFESHDLLRTCLSPKGRPWRRYAALRAGIKDNGLNPPHLYG